MANITQLLWEGTLPELNKDNLYQVVKDFCVSSSCYVAPPIETDGHYHFHVWGKTEGKTRKNTLDPSIATVLFYEPTKRVKVFLNDLESVSNPSEDLAAFLHDLPFGLREQVEHLVWWVLDKYVGRSLADGWQHKQKQNLLAISRQRESALEFLTLPQVSTLGKRITNLFNDDELRDLARKLSIDYENLSGDNKFRKAPELVEHCVRHGKVPELWSILHEERPRGNWSEVLI